MLDHIERQLRGEVPPPPIARLIGFESTVRPESNHENDHHAPEARKKVARGKRGAKHSAPPLDLVHQVHQVSEP
jgi:hypothetical protein